jgi:hypothetical protein
MISKEIIKTIQKKNIWSCKVLKGREGWIAGSTPVAKRFAPSTPQRRNNIFRPWHPTESKQRLFPEGRRGRPSAERKRARPTARQL